ncbi:hypothetical protein HDU81_002003, partial [Chytriomyces hyalinus]
MATTVVLHALHTKIYFAKTAQDDTSPTTWFTHLCDNLGVPELTPLLNDKDHCLDLFRMEYRTKYGKHHLIRKKNMSVVEYQSQ